MALYVNNSLLRLLRECETKTWLRWGQELVMRERDAPGPMNIGRVVHRVVEGWLQGLDVDFMTVYQEEVGDVLPYSERLYPMNVETVLHYWMQAQAGQDRRYQVVQTEQILQARLGVVDGEEIIYYGTIDSLIEWSGALWMLEHKTTGNMDGKWASQWRMAGQLMGYVWLLREHGVKAKGSFVNGIEIRKLPPWDGNMSKKCGTHHLKYEQCQGMHVKHTWVGPLTWSERRISQWRQDVLRLVQRLLYIKETATDTHYGLGEIKMDGQLTWPGCARCSYQPFCEAERPVRGLAQMMVHEAWRGPALADVDEEVGE